MTDASSPPGATAHPWFDAHLDLAYLAVSGRDMTTPLDPRVGPHPPAGVTLPALAEGRVRLCLGTVFTEVGGLGPEGYPEGDFERAAAVGRAQLEAYLTWRDRGLISLDRLACLRSQRGVGEVRGGMGVAEVVPLGTRARLARLARTPALHVGVLIENADPVRSPAELGWWKERGVVAVGLSWARSSRYAGGNSSGTGLTGAGREMAAEMDRLGLVHDASHLSDRAFADLCAATPRRIVASHSNCRAIADPSGREQRHLTDDQVREIGRRDGVVGLNLFSRFLRPGLEGAGRAGIEDCVAHVERVCDLTGSRRHVGLGSDMDGGFAADRTPAGIDSPRGLGLIAAALAARGWTEDDVLGFTCGNWARVFG